MLCALQQEAAVQGALEQAQAQHELLVQEHKQLQAKHHEQSRAHQQVVGENSNSLTQIAELEARSALARCSSMIIERYSNVVCMHG